MKKVTGQNLGVFWPKVGWAILGQVNDLQVGNNTQQASLRNANHVFRDDKTAHTKTQRQIWLNCLVCSALNVMWFRSTMSRPTNQECTDFYLVCRFLFAVIQRVQICQTGSLEELIIGISVMWTVATVSTHTAWFFCQKKAEQSYRGWRWQENVKTNSFHLQGARVRLLVHENTSSPLLRSWF